MKEGHDYTYYGNLKKKDNLQRKDFLTTNLRL